MSLLSLSLSSPVPAGVLRAVAVAPAVVSGCFVLSHVLSLPGAHISLYEVKRPGRTAPFAAVLFDRVLNQTFAAVGPSFALAASCCSQQSEEVHNERNAVVLARLAEHEALWENRE